MSKNEKDLEKELKKKFGDVFIVSQKTATEPDFFKAMQKFQYGETRETSNKGFNEMKEIAEDIRKKKQK